jgi:NAD(P)-dependent dehydrogenase (short-subunit alcohol dehydrogenase family)
MEVSMLHEVYDFAVDMKGKTCLVTGATSGHGEAVAEFLARKGADLIIHGRNPEKLKKVSDNIYNWTGRKPEQLIINFSSMDDIRKKTSEFNKKKRKIHLLVNNAGMVNQGLKLSEDGYEEVLAVNYFAMFLFTLLLLDNLKSAVPSRIVNVSSDAHYIGKLDLSDIDQKKNYSLMGAYGRSKLAIIYFTRELSEKLKGTGVTVNALDPGPIASGIAKKPSLLAKFADLIIQATFPDPLKAAKTCLYLCMSPEVKDITGGYFRFMEKKEPKINFNPEFSHKLWEITSVITGVDLKMEKKEKIKVKGK